MDRVVNSSLKTQYFHFIDVLRFVAILISFLHHSNIVFFLYGHTFFFVLSGFVLTFQASNEYNLTNNFGWFNFTMRRVLRIFPLYFLIIGVSYLIVPQLTDQQITLAPVAYYLTFTSNYYSISHVFILMILWSVAVQEQFYFFISFCYKFFYKYLNLIGLIMILISTVYKTTAEFYGLEIYAHTLNHFSSFGVGILIANIYLNGKVVNVKKKINRIVLFAILVLLMFASVFNNTCWSIINNTIVSLIFGYIILFLIPVKINQNNIVFRALEKLGQFSYGLYCFQGLVITFGNIFFMRYLGISNAFLVAVINFSLLIIISYTSYYFFEKRLLNLKKYFR